MDSVPLDYRSLMMNINFINLLIGKIYSGRNSVSLNFLFCFFFLHVFGYDKLSEFFMCSTQQEKAVKMFAKDYILVKYICIYAYLGGLF